MVLGITPYLRFSMILSAVTSVIRLANSKVTSYMLIFIIIMYGFGTAGFIIYGDKIPAYSSILRGSLEMILATLGGIQYNEMREINSWITPLFAFSYLIFANTIFLKTFLLIIQEEYNDYFKAYAQKGSGLVSMIVASCEGYTTDVITTIYRLESKSSDLNRSMNKSGLSKIQALRLRAKKMYITLEVSWLKGARHLLKLLLNYIKPGSSFMVESEG